MSVRGEQLFPSIYNDNYNGLCEKTIAIWYNVELFTTVGCWEDFLSLTDYLITTGANVRICVSSPEMFAIPASLSMCYFDDIIDCIAEADVFIVFDTSSSVTQLNIALASLHIKVPLIVNYQ